MGEWRERLFWAHSGHRAGFLAVSAIEQKAAIVDIPRLTPIELAGRVTGWWGPLYRQVRAATTLAYPLCPCAASPCAVRMDQDEERQFLESLTLKVWKARTEGAIIGAAFVLGIGLLLYLVTGTIFSSKVDPWRQ